MKLFLFFFLGMLCFIFSCTDNEQHARLSTTQETKIYRPRLNPDVNSDHKYEVISETTSITEVNDEESESFTKIDMGMSYAIKKDTSGQFDFTMTYDKFRLSAEAFGQKKVIDMQNAANSFDQSERMFSAFKSVRLQLKVDTGGNVRSISGLQELGDNMRNLATGNAEAIQLLNTSLQQYAGQENLKLMFEKSFKFLPDTLLQEGYKWESSESLAGGLGERITNKYKVESMEDKVITVSSSMKIHLEDRPIKIENANVIATLKGDQSGKMQIDMRTGMLLSLTSNMDIRGDITVMGKKIPLSIVAKNSIKKL